MELIEGMKKYLPITVFPTKDLYKQLRKRGIKIDLYKELQISTVFDSEEAGGIVCSIMQIKGEVIVVSLTHLRIKPDHPLSDKIIKYQRDRIKRLSESK